MGGERWGAVLTTGQSTKIDSANQVAFTEGVM